MTLYELAYACRLYRDQFDAAYDQMREAMGQNPDLASQAQQDTLMRFLNDWGCRIAEKNFPILKMRLQQWAAMWVTQLPDVGRDIRTLDESERAKMGAAYEALLHLGAGLHFQDTAAAKTLHALRPLVLPIWDAKIKGWFIDRYGFSKRRAGQVYSDFLHHIADEISDLEVDVVRLGYSLGDISKLVHGSRGSLVKLVDEYYWVTVTDGRAIPTRVQVEQWFRWIP